MTATRRQVGRPRQVPFANAHHRCAGCGEKRHEYLYPYADRRRIERDLTRCLPCIHGDSGGELRE
ncbi:hypothetical protein [Micromonospora sp. NPDC049891]|uniref:hypothetical protein n=1 Tax=Micromonospora sp. NPDC049891 TaxID=3155655 RepID=UPI0033D008B3